MKLPINSIAHINTLGHIEMEGYDLLDIARKIDGPFYIYFASVIEKQYKRLKALLPTNMDICYAVKANPNREILTLFKTLKSAFDISSGGEFSRCMDAGISPQKISFSGPGKDYKELSEAIRNKLFAISVESRREVDEIIHIADTTASTANVMLRINPTRKPERFSLKMGGLPSQFGIDEETALEIIRMIKKHDLLDLMGIHVFNGTQCLDARAIVENISEMIEIAKRLFLHEGIELRYINLGGGFGIPYYEGDRELNLEEVCNAVKDIIIYTQETSHGLKNTRFILELGRFLVAQSGIYIAKVIDIKISRGKKFIILNGGMNHHLAASGNFGQVLRRNYCMYPLELRDKNRLEKVNIVGPLCTSIDRLASDIQLPVLMIGDYIGIFNSGAYGLTASPILFLLHNLPAEVFVSDEELKIVRATGGIQYETQTIRYSAHQ
ncbi:MAG: hypothetical protein MRK02_11240 [Candidatus Scalindua sp.]|nr:hypothetical protein [Candidatus Scalindua sp.]